MLDLSTIKAYAAIAELGTFSAAATTLNINVSTVTRKLDVLEAQLGARLIDRTTRVVNLTEAGLAFLPYVKSALLTIDGGVDQLLQYQKLPVGVVRVQTMPSVGRLIAKELHHILGEHPQLNINLKVLHAAPRLDMADFDIAIWPGLPPENRTVVRLLTPLKLGLLASTHYLKKHNLNRSPVELANFLTLSELPFGAFSYDAVLPKSVAHSPYGRSESSGWESLSEISPAIVSNDPDAILHAIASGAIAGRMGYWAASELICRGEVVPLDPSLSETVPLYAVLPSMHAIPEKTKVFLRFLEERITPELLRRENEALSYLAEPVASE